MGRLTTNTGLLPVSEDRSKSGKHFKFQDQPQRLELCCNVCPAPYTLRPFAGLYNPFTKTCSILCNHPANLEAKEYVKKAKDGWFQEQKQTSGHMRHLSSLFSPDDNDLRRSSQDIFTEDMFRRYTETDSRPHTPAPTLASGISRISRRCLTPEQPKKTSIVVDLRRSHSQETIFYHAFTSETGSIQGASTVGSFNLPYIALPRDIDRRKGRKEHLPPLVSPATLSRRNTVRTAGSSKHNQLKAFYSKRKTKSKTKANVQTQQSIESLKLDEHDNDQTEKGEIRRRGRRRKKKGQIGRLPSGLLVTQTSQDPETQVAGIDTDSQNPSSRNSVADGEQQLILPALKVGISTKKIDSFLDDEILKFLHRDVDEDAIEKEFNPKRRYVLEEAYRTKPHRELSEEVQHFIRKLEVPKPCLADWLHTPRTFSRKSSKFHLPLDTHELLNMTPMKYASHYVTVAKSKQLLYLTVLQKFKPHFYKMPVENIAEGLKLMMGGILTDENVENLRQLLDWDTYEEIEIVNEISSFESRYSQQNSAAHYSETEDKVIRFKTWCGVCAICERFYGKFKPRNIDPPDGMEINDFALLHTKLAALNVDCRLVELLQVIRTH